MSAPLLPCPFCRRTPFAFPRTCDRTTPYNPAHRAFPQVRCPCGISVDGTDWTGTETAISNWNKRAELSADTLATLTQLCFVIRTGGDVLAACEGAEKQIAKAMGEA